MKMKQYKFLTSIAYPSIVHNNRFSDYIASNRTPTKSSKLEKKNAIPFFSTSPS